MPDLTHVKLARATHLELRIRGDGKLEVRRQGARFLFPPSAMAVLAAFDRPQTVSEAIRNLTAWAGISDSREQIFDTILQLYHAGALADPSDALGGAPAPPLDPMHIELLNARLRTTR